MTERHPILEQMLEKVFPEERERVKAGKCPFCGKEIDPDTEFRDEKSRKEFDISGMCQKCQDELFQRVNDV